MPRPRGSTPADSASATALVRAPDLASKVASHAPVLVRHPDQSPNEPAPDRARAPLRPRLVRRPDHSTKEAAPGAVVAAAERRLVRQPDHEWGARPGRDQEPGVVAAGRALVIGCGALAPELLAVTAGLPGLDVVCLPPDLHNRPERIPDRVRTRIRQARSDGYERIFVAYADCGTGGLLDPVLAAESVERLPGAHCYEVFAGTASFEAMADAEPGTFWLTDFLARNFERLVIRGLGIDRHPELEATYFAHYRRVVFLSQSDDPDLLAMARRAAERLGLAFEHRPTGTINLAAPIRAWAGAGASGAVH